MRRMLVIALAAAVSILLTAQVAGAKTGTFAMAVGGIAEFITNNPTGTSTSSDTIDTWDVDLDGGTAGTQDTADATIVFRVVMNQDVTLTGSFDTALQQTLTGGELAQLLTYANITTDGDGTGSTTAAATHDTGNAWSGFASADYDTDQGVGTNNYAYIGGLATSANEPVSTGTPQYGATATSDFLDNGVDGVDVTHVAKDGAALVTVIVRGMNGEDFGATSDSTEAPDSGTCSCTLTITATP